MCTRRWAVAFGAALVVAACEHAASNSPTAVLRKPPVAMEDSLDPLQVRIDVPYEPTGGYFSAEIYGGTFRDPVHWEWGWRTGSIGGFQPFYWPYDYGDPSKRNMPVGDEQWFFYEAQQAITMWVRLRGFSADSQVAVDTVRISFNPGHSWWGWYREASYMDDSGHIHRLSYPYDSVGCAASCASFISGY